MRHVICRSCADAPAHEPPHEVLVDADATLYSLFKMAHAGHEIVEAAL